MHGTMLHGPHKYSAHHCHEGNWYCGWHGQGHVAFWGLEVGAETCSGLVTAEEFEETPGQSFEMKEENQCLQCLPHARQPMKYRQKTQ